MWGIEEYAALAEIVGSVVVVATLLFLADSAPPTQSTAEIRVT